MTQRPFQQEDRQMADFLSDLAAKAGLNSEQTSQGVSALLASLKSRLSPEAFAHLKNAIPGSEAMLASVQENAESAGAGLVESVKNVAGKIWSGAKQAPTALAGLTSAGWSGDQVKNFLPKLHDMLANKLPENVLAQIQEHLPGLKPSEEEALSTKG
jgi:uncharacterized protein (DUF2267 family)